MRGLQLLFVLVCLLIGGHAFGQSDIGRIHLIYVGGANDPQLKWFETNADLAALKKAVTFSHLKTTDQIFLERYQPVLGNAAPMVVLERDDGGTIYAADGQAFPRTGSDLFNAMRVSYHQATNAMRAEAPRPEQVFGESPPCVGPDCPETRFPNLSFPSIDGSRRVPDARLPFAEGVVDRATNFVWLIFAIAAFAFMGFVLLLSVWLVSIFMRKP